MDWNTFIISILGSGAISALVNTLMNHRTQMQMVKESGLYSKRAGVLDLFVQKMEDLDSIMKKLVSGFQVDTSEKAENERRKQAMNLFNDFFEFYKKNRHYLSKELADQIGQICKEYQNLFVDFSYKANPVAGQKRDIELWIQLENKIQIDFELKKESVVEEFRKIIGVK